MIAGKDLAIKYALENNWKLAASTNEEILAENPNDIESLNRLGFALMKLGKYKKAKETYKKVLTFDKTNPIATKNLKRLDMVSKQKPNEAQELSPKMIASLQDMFIEEAGKTRTVDLKNVADKKTLSLLQSGDSVNLIIKRSKIFIQDGGKKYIGMLPDSVGARLIKFIKGGNEYSAFVKACDDKNVTVFLKEVKKMKRFVNQPSFSSINFSYQTFEEE